MAYSKSFPKRSDKSAYPRWEDVELSEEEESRADLLAREENIRLFRECIQDAKKILVDERLKGYETSLVSVAISLFEKRASHSVYWKERLAREKFLRADEG